MAKIEDLTVNITARDLVTGPDARQTLINLISAYFDIPEGVSEMKVTFSTDDVDRWEAIGAKVG